MGESFRIFPTALVSVVLAAAMAWWPDTARAAPPAVEITPMIGYRSSGGFEDPNTGEQLDLEEGASIGLVVNVDHGANTQWEFMLGRQSTDLQTGVAFSDDRLLGMDVFYGTAGGIYVWRDPRAEPFVGAGIGITHMAPDDSRFDSETRVLFSLVGGYRFRLTDQLGLRFEVRGYETVWSSDTAIFCGNGGCVARVDGTGFGQLELNAGLTLRF